MQIKKTTKIDLVGRGQLSINPGDHVATGGEGSIYRKGKTVIKLYSDPQKMVRDGMPDKLELLAKIDHPFIIAPRGIVLDENGKPLGYYMDFVTGEPLSRVFTNDFRQREGLVDKDSSTLVERMREAVQTAHDHNAVMVDHNELNWMAVLKKKPDIEPRVLDVDSWAIGKWPAKVIMPSIRDWHSKDFNSLTDWFSWGIVTFQVYTGIHPYKGKLDGYQMKELEKRMKDNASVFSPGVRLNKAVRDFSVIPGPLLDWYNATFQKGERSMPPSPFAKGVATTRAAQIARRVVTGSGSLLYDKIFEEVGDPVLRVFPCGIVLLKSGKLYNVKSKKQIGLAESVDCEVIENPDYWLIADIKDGELKFTAVSRANLQSVDLKPQIAGSKFLRYENRLFVVTQKGLTELSLKVFAKPIIANGNTWGAQVNSTRFYDGVGVQDSMGATYLILPFGESACAQVRVRELDGLKPVTAKSEDRFVAITVVNQQGEYKKIELTFDKEYKNYSFWEGDSDTPELNMAVLPGKRVAAIITQDGELNIFVPVNGTLKKVQDSFISTDMILSNWEDQVVYMHKGALWSLSMKKK